MNTETMIKELNAVVEKHKNDFVPTFQINISAMCRDIIPKLEQLAEYEEIGTVDECREARERQRGKKPKRIIDESKRFYRYYCPVCGRYFGNDHRKDDVFLFKERYCQGENCGQVIDWSE